MEWDKTIAKEPSDKDSRFLQRISKLSQVFIFSHRQLLTDTLCVTSLHGNRRLNKTASTRTLTVRRTQRSTTSLSTRDSTQPLLTHTPAEQNRSPVAHDLVPPTPARADAAENSTFLSTAPPSHTTPAPAATSGSNRSWRSLSLATPACPPG